MITFRDIIKESTKDKLNALIKKYGNDPVYLKFLTAKNPEEAKKAWDALKSIKGDSVANNFRKEYAKM